MDQNLLVYLLAAALIVIGVVGTVLPALPGPPLVFAGMLLGAWVDNFHLVSVGMIVVLALITVVALAIDVVASLLGAKRVGASKLAILGATLGGIVGLFLGPPGWLLGPFAGALGGEWLHGRDLAKASRVGVGTWTGMVVGAVCKLGLVCVMLGLFALAIVFR